MNLNLFAWLKNWKTLIIVNLFFFSIHFVQAQDNAEEEGVLKTLFSKLGSEVWATRESAFQCLLTQRPSLCFERLLQEALCDSDAEIQNLAERLRHSRLFLVSEELQQRIKTPFVTYPKCSLQKRQVLLELAYHQGESWAIGFFLKILIHDPSLEIRPATYEFLLALFSQYSPEDLKQSLSKTLFVEEHFWLTYVEAQLLLRSRQFSTSVPIFDSAFQKISDKLKQQEEKSIPLDPVELELFEETGRILTILAILENRFSDALSYCDHPRLRLSNVLSLDILASQIQDPAFNLELILIRFLKKYSENELEKLALILFPHSQDSPFLSSLRQTLQQKKFKNQLKRLFSVDSEDFFKFWIPRLALKPEGIVILKQFFLPFASEEILAMTIAYLGYQRNAEDVALLAPFLDHRNKSVQLFTISALGHIGTANAHQQLRTLLKKLDSRSERLLENLEPEDSAEFIAEIKPFLENEDEMIRAHAVRLLPLNEVSNLGQDSSLRVRFQVFRKWSQSQNPDRYSVVFAFLKDEEDLLFESALEQLLAWKNIYSKLPSDLKSRLLEEPEDFRKCTLKQALVVLGDPLYLEVLFSDLKHSDEQIRLLALDFVTPWLSQDQNFKKLDFCLRDLNSEIRSKAVEVLRGISDPYVEAWMKRLLFDRHHSVQFQVIQNLEFLEQPEYEKFIEFGYRKLLEAYPEHSLYQISWAKWLWSTHKKMQAQIEAESLVRWNPEDLDTRQFLLKVYHQTENFSKREQTNQWLKYYYLQQLLEKPEEEAFFKNNWAWTFADAGYNLEKALLLVNDALKQSREAHILDTKAEILTQQNKKKEAKFLLWEALQRADELPLKIYLQRKLHKLESKKD
ncbi:MAG: hypothetical protein AABZ60_07840 [Planctomycetota bacterium]